MSTTETTPAVKGIRYTDAQKKEVVDFAMDFNAANGRGGQSKAAENFKISQITVAAWLKAAGAPPLVKKSTAKVKKASKSNGATKAGVRYSPEQKQDVVDFVNAYNAENGRGGQSKAAEKFSVSPLTVMAWLKNTGAPKPSKKVAAVAGNKGAKKSSGSGFSARLDSLVAMNKQIERAEAELATLHAKFAVLKASL